MALAALVISIISAVVAVSSAIIGSHQLREDRVANSLPVVIDLFREYRSGELSTARRIVFECLTDAHKDLPLSQLPDNVRHDAYRVSHFFDNLGVMIAEGLMRPELAARFLGDSAIALWMQLAPCIEKERDRRASETGGSDYQRYFEDLAVRLREIDPTRSRSVLKRWHV